MAGDFAAHPPGAMPSLLATTVPSYSARTRSLPANLRPASRRPSAIASLVLRKKNEIDIVLDGEAEFVHSYSTYDEVSGNVCLTFEKDTPIDDVIITFEGQTTTYVEKIATTAPTTGRTTGKHTFLKLLQPIEEQQLPADSILRAGEMYKIPFLFNIPDRLLPYVCSHKVESENIRKYHTQLPPSLGDPSTSGNGHMLMDDLAPAMSKITYAIRARAIQRLQPSNKLVELAEKVERIRVVPQREEEPPVTLTEDGDFCFRKEKSVKKGLFKIGKIGRLTAETTQPRSLRLPHPTKKVSEPVTTMTNVNLRFDPLTGDEEPPQLGSLGVKLRIYTFFGAAPYKLLPKVHRCDNWSNLHGLYPISVELSSRNLSTVAWTKHDPSSPTYESDAELDLRRRPSTFSTLSGSSSSMPEPSALYQPGGVFYTASILVPVSLPDPYTSKSPKVFVPSFHSCIVSRSYTLELNLSYRTPGTKVSSPSVILKTPVQISQEGGVAPAGIHESDEAIVSEIERQFGLYEQRQLEEGLGLETPAYEEEETPLIDRRGTIAAGAGAAPPEYNAAGGFRRAGEPMRVGGARTQSSEWQRSPSTISASSGDAGMAMMGAAAAVDMRVWTVRSVRTPLLFTPLGVYAAY